MRNALPVMREDTTTLKQRLHHDQHGRKRPRLQMLYRLASGQAQSRRRCPTLGSPPPYHRPLARAQAGGLEALLDLYVPAARPYRSPRTCWRSWSRPSGSRRVSPRTRPCGNGSSNTLTWRSRITPSTPSSARGSRPSSRCRAPVTQKNPDGDSRLSGELWGAVHDGHPAGEYPPGARVQPGRQSLWAS